MSDAGNSPGARSRSASPGARSPRDRSPPPRRDSRSRSRSPADGKEAAPRDSSGSGGGGGGGGGGDTDNPGNNVYVANLAMRVTEDDLNDLFAKFGRVDKCEVILDPVSRTSRGFGFVTFEDIRDAEDAVKEMNGKEIQGRRIRVEHAKRKRGHEKTPGRYLGPRQASAKYGRDSREGDRGRDRSRDRDRRRSRSRSRDRGGHSRRSDDYDRDRYERSRYDDRGDRGRDRYDDSRRTRR